MGITGVPPLLRELTDVMTNLRSTLTSLAQASVGDGSVNFLGHSMNALQVAQTAESAVRDWIGQPGNVLQMGEIAFSTVFGFCLSLVLLFYFLCSGLSVMRRRLWLVPPARRPFVLDIWSKLDPVLGRYFVGRQLVAARMYTGWRTL